MDDSGRIIVDISSDEDVGWGDSGVTSDGGGGCCWDDSNWISELLDEVEKETDDSDELLMVREVVSNPKQMVVKSVAKPVDSEEEDDDDCVILDNDPDKPITVENHGGEDSDDLCVVGEKGQVACRDYPHPRHLCVQFPFDSTPHEKHCNQCHCYVCDSVAPCGYWGNGASSVDHCHASEKDEFWKAQRSHSKKGYKAPQTVSGMELPPISQVPSLPSNQLRNNQVLPESQSCHIASTGSPVSGMPVRTQDCGYNKVPSLASYTLMHTAGLPGSQPCSINSTDREHRPMRTQGSGCNLVPSLVRNPLMQDIPSSQPRSITSAGTPNRMMPMRTQVSGYDRNKFRPHLVSYHLRRHNVGHAGTQYIPQCVPFKRPGTVGGVLTSNRHGNNSSRNYYGYQFSRNQPPRSRWQDPRARANVMSYAYEGSNQENFGGVSDSVTNSTTWSPVSNAHGNYGPLHNFQDPTARANVMTYAFEGSNQENFGRVSDSVPNSTTWSPVSNAHGNYAPLQSQVSSQIYSYSVSANSVASHSQHSPQTCVGSNFGNSIPAGRELATQQTWDSSFANLAPLQPKTAFQPNVGTYQNVVPTQQLVNCNDDLNCPSESPVNFYQNSPVSQNSQSYPVEYTQLLSTTSEMPAVVINSPSPSSNSHQMDLHFNTWSSEDKFALEDKSALEDLDFPLSPGPDLFSTESTLMDAGFHRYLDFQHMELGR